LSQLRCSQVKTNRPFEGNGKNILPRYDPAFMRLVDIGRRRLGKIDPKEEKPRNSEKE